MFGVIVWFGLIVFICLDGDLGLRLLFGVDFRGLVVLEFAFDCVWWVLLLVVVLGFWWLAR